MMMSMLWGQRHISSKCLLWWKTAVTVKTRGRIMRMEEMVEIVEMTARDLMMMLLSMRVQHLKVGWTHRRGESLGTATGRIEVYHHFGSSRPILQVQQMQGRIKTLSQFEKLFKGSTRRSGNKR